MHPVCLRTFNYKKQQQETIHLTTKPDLKINRKDLQKPFQFVTSQTKFLFNGNMYDQVDDSRQYFNGI